MSPLPKKSPREGRHPARSRRKRNQRPRPLTLWEVPAHWNMLTPAVFLIGVLLAQALIMSPLLIEMPVLSRHAWLAGVFVLAWLAAIVTAFLQPFAHLYWNITDELIKSTQPGRGGSYSRTYPNAHFVSLESYGPLIQVRRESGAAHLWPRWLRRDGQTYAFELHYDKLRLRAVTSPGSR